MKSIKNFTVLNTWALLVDFLIEHWFIIMATTTEIFIRAFMVTCSSATWTMKVQDAKIWRYIPTKIRRWLSMLCSHSMFVVSDSTLQFRNATSNFNLTS